MKKLISLLLILNFAFLKLNSVFAQAPPAISYQAVARDTAGNLIADQAISLRFSIRNTSAAGPIVYQETQSKTTSTLGLFTANIGQGTVVSGIFANIDWGGGSKFIQVELDAMGGTTYTDMGTQQLLSVPYALNAANGNWTKNGNIIFNSNSGNVGIGTTTPGSKLEVNGQVKITGGAPAVGRVLTSDGNGLASWQSIASNFQPKYTTGLNAGLGGYVIYVTPDSLHGLVSEIQDQGVSSYYEATDLISDPNNHSVIGKNFTDWRLPSRWELFQMYDKRGFIGGFDLTGASPYFSFYWTSTQSGLGLSWLVLFTNGNTFINDFESNTNRVRAIRSF